MNYYYIEFRKASAIIIIVLTSLYQKKKKQKYLKQKDTIGIWSLVLGILKFNEIP